MSNFDERLWIYNAKDTVITWEVSERIQENIDQMGLREPADFQQILFNAVLESMLRGVRIDVARRGEYEMLLLDEINARETWFNDVLGHPLNPRSGKQMQSLFYSDLKQRIITKRATGMPTLDDSALTTLGEREPLLLPLIRKIQEYRSLGVFLSTFVRMPLDQDQRMRTSFNIAGTETYRFSSSENPFGNGGNLQNLPKGGDDGDGLDLPNIRELFLPDPGTTFWDLDLSAADLRIVIYESDETELKAILREGKDVYTEIAKEFYHDPSITKQDPRRQKFKSFCHGSNYGGSARGLAQRLGLTVHEAERTQSWYFQKHSKIKAWQDRIKEQLTKRHYIENIWGYRYYLFDRIDDNAFRAAMAWQPQSTVACLINRGYYNIYKNLREVWVLLQVHDSIAGTYPTHLGDWAKRRIIEECSITLPYEDPLIIPVGLKTSTKSWGDCHE